MNQPIQQQATPFPTKKVISGSFLVMGTSVGAGMLGIPNLTAAAGFIPSIWITLAVWAFMYLTGLLLLEVTLKMPAGSNLFSIAQNYFGKVGTWVTATLFILLYYCLVMAYIAGGSPLWMGGEKTIHFILFTTISALITYRGVRFVDRLNVFLSLSMLVAYLLMFFSAIPMIETKRLIGTFSLTHAFWAVPVLFGAFGYHNVIPTLANYLQRDRRALMWSIGLGTLAAAGIYLIWQCLILGSIDVAALNQSLSEGKTAVSALQSVTGNPWIYLYGKWFAALALLTSLLGVSLSIVDFFADGFRQFSWKAPRSLLCALTFVPPLLFATYHPQIFMTALGIAGGIGEALLNALFPIAAVWTSRYILKQKQGEILSLQKRFLFTLFACSIGAIVIEILTLLR